MNLENAARDWRADGFVILPEFIPSEELTPAVSELSLLFPSAEGFHEGTDPRRSRFIGDEFAGIDTFPFASTEISLLAVNHRILALAQALLDAADAGRHGAAVPGTRPHALVGIRSRTTQVLIALHAPVGAVGIGSIPGH
ncbi:hypothetical protein [Actinomadura sp. 3N508]|uniref:hypothetical protein n=1 Tax=Actinomadura sp. 3N508 TaxID=3375153 RepID=UPI00378AEE85